MENSASPIDAGTLALFTAEVERRKNALQEESSIRALRTAARLAGLTLFTEILTAVPANPDQLAALLQDFIQQQPENLPVWLAGHDAAFRRAMGVQGAAAPCAAATSAAVEPRPAATVAEPAEAAEAAEPSPENTELSDLFVEELKTRLRTLEEGLLQSEYEFAREVMDQMVRSAHAIKGAALIAGIAELAQMAGEMENIFIKTREKQTPLLPKTTDGLLHQLDAMKTFAGLQSEPVTDLRESDITTEGYALPVASQTLSALANLAGETLIAAHRADHLGRKSLLIKTQVANLTAAVENPNHLNPAPLARTVLRDMQDLVAAMDRHAIEAQTHSQRLYEGILAIRMRPMAELLNAFPRVVRDMAHTNKKAIALNIIGAETRVDREILQVLDAPITHLIRNACAHGIELPEEREINGKSPTGTITMEASQRMGFLILAISDDGQGVDMNTLRKIVIERNLSSPELLDKMSHKELLDFLFLPGFSTQHRGADLEGRGIGLDVVHTIVSQVGGQVTLESEPGRGTRVEMSIPLSLAIQRGLQVSIAGEPYLFPLAQIDQVRHLTPDDWTRGRVEESGRTYSLVRANRLLALPDETADEKITHAILLSNTSLAYAVAVEEIIGEYDVVLRPLPPQLGRIETISAAAILGDGTPVLVFTANELLNAAQRLQKLGTAAAPDRPASRAKILLVEDSKTVCEAETKILQDAGYEVITAADGAAAIALIGAFLPDLILSDVDMPCMDGLEMTRRLRELPQTRKIPIILISYKDRPEDMQSGLDAGADLYLPKTAAASARELLHAIQPFLKD